MKNEINKLETVPATKEDMIEVLQELWSEVDPKRMAIFDRTPHVQA